MTCVWVKSKIELAGLWLKSIETSGSSLVSSTPFEPVAACWIAPLISAISVSRAASNLKSMSETFGVGTRMEVPSSLPFNPVRPNRQPSPHPSKSGLAIATPPGTAHVGMQRIRCALVAREGVNRCRVTSLIPIAWLRTYATGSEQVVQDAFETTVWLGSNWSWLIP